ncbi:MAG: EpsG family protein [Pseudomonadota bacterium]|nr:EpsG family protein [Pseudomonadota bacterium]
MFAYWFLFAYFAVGVLLGSHDETTQRSRPRPMLALGALLIAVLVGFRYEVGADWQAYQRMFAFAGLANFDRILALKDPGYQILNWLAQQFGAGIWMVNLVCGSLLAWGLSRFARVQPEPWLAVLIAIPYLVVVVAMGYSRQGVAIGLLLAGLAAISRGASPLRFVLYVAAAALFHKTAVIALLLVVFASEKNRFLNTTALVAAFVLMYDIFLDDSVDTFMNTYIDAEYSSQGAAIRIAMTVLPAALFLLRPNKFGFLPREKKVWINFSIATFVLLAMLFLLPSSTAVDRLTLYIIPLQIVILSRFPIASGSRTVVRILVVVYCFAIQFAWLNYASHANEWIPYRLYSFGAGGGN